MNKRLIAAVNIFIMFMVMGSTIFYVNRVKMEQDREEKSEFIHTAEILTGIADTYVSNEKKFCESLADFLDNRQYSMKEAMELLKKQSNEENNSVHLIWKDSLKGYSTQAIVSEKGKYNISYKNIAFILEKKTGNRIQVTPRYINPVNGEVVVSFYTQITLLDSTYNAKQAYLFHVIPEKTLKKNWAFPTEYSDKVSVALISSDGSYILKPYSMKNEDFYSFIYSFNQGKIDTDSLANKIQKRKQGEFMAENSRGENSLYTFYHLNINKSWVLITTIPINNLSSTMNILYLPALVFIAMVILLMIDISFYHSIENRLIENEKELMHALSDAEYANRAKTNFLNNMSHDIRTPMNAIIGFTNLALKHIENQSLVSDYLSKISVSGNHLLSLINDILDMSRIESGKIVLNEEDISLSDVLCDLQTILEADMIAHNLNFTVDMENVTIKNVICDKLRLNQILLNLLGNSLKFTPPGGQVSLKIIQKKEAPDGFASYEFHVKDTGIGMSYEFIKHIFEPFTREKSSTTSGIQGTGLGMAITSNLVTIMGGDIAVHSEEAKGTEFIVNLTFRIGEEKSETENISENESHVHGKSLLIVEDNELNRQIAATLLSEDGFLVECAEDGDVAVEKIKNEAANKYDLILMDIQMPRMNGYEATRQIRQLQDKKKASIPIVAMTADAFAEDVKASREAGMNGHLGKPIDERDVLRILEEIFTS